MEKEKPNVYFAAPIRGDRTMEQTFRDLIAFLKESDVTVFTEHVSERNTDGGNTPEYIEKRDIAWLNEASHVIAEISGASTGVGREIEYARTKEHFGKTPARILCLYHHLEREFFASPMVRGMDSERYPNVSVRAYRDIEDAKEIVRNFIGVS